MREVARLRERLALLDAATLRINESLDLEEAMQGLLDGARSLTGAAYAVATVLGARSEVQEVFASGGDGDRGRRPPALPGGTGSPGQAGVPPGPSRGEDLPARREAGGLAAEAGPGPAGPATALLDAPVRHRGEAVGHLYLTGRREGGDFSGADREALAALASQAALVISSARRYREEQRARADLESLIHIAPVGVVVLETGSGAVLSVNREARRIGAGLLDGGGSLDDLPAVVRVRRADGREVSMDHSVEEAFSPSETVRAEEVVVTAPGGRSIEVLINATPLRTAEGALDSYVVTLQDLAPIKEMERLRADFFAMVSHELQTPLSSIKGSVRSLLEHSPDLSRVEAEQFFRIIDQQADHLRQLVGDLLDVARIESGTLHVAPEPAALGPLLEETRTRFQSATGRSDLRMDVAADLPRVMADGRRIVQVLTNLLSDAATHAPPGSGILLTTARDGVHVALSVVDRGSRPPEERRGDAFRRSYQLAAGARARAAEDAGLALAICRGIVEAHGGRIWAERAGPGHRVTFTVPAVEEPAPGPTGLPDRPRPGDAVRERVLVVDDDVAMLRHVRAVLSEAGYQATSTGDPQEVPQLMAEVEPHLVLLDLVLHESDGMRVMETIHEIADVPVIFLSAYGRDRTIAEALDSGASDYVRKPFSPTELVARIGAALRQRVPPGPEEPAAPYVLGDLAVDYARRAVSVAGRPLSLTPLEYRMLRELTLHAGVVLTHDHLLARLWSPARSDRRPMRSVVRTLRRKLGDDAGAPRYVFTEPGIGYYMPRGD